MESIAACTQTEMRKGIGGPLVMPVCPLCGGDLTLLRGFSRCLQCGYIICESCEGEIEEDGLAGPVGES
jgi:hypothetical protein